MRACTNQHRWGFKQVCVLFVYRNAQLHCFGLSLDLATGFSIPNKGKLLLGTSPVSHRKRPQAVVLGFHQPGLIYRPSLLCFFVLISSDCSCSQNFTSLEVESDFFYSSGHHSCCGNVMYSVYLYFFVLCCSLE